MKRLLVLAAVALGGLLMVTPTAAESDTICPPDLIGGAYDNVVVPPGASCHISGATVLGNVKALENSELVIDGGSTVHGNVEGDKADLVQVNFATVRENITIKEGGPATPPFPAGTIECGAIGNACEAYVIATTVPEGNVQIEKMTGTVNVHFSTVAKGSLKVEENFIPGPGPENIFIGSISIAQNLQVLKNTGSGEKFVLGNTHFGNLQCKENDLPFTGGPNSGPGPDDPGDQCF